MGFFGGRSRARTYDPLIKSYPNPPLGGFRNCGTPVIATLQWAPSMKATWVPLATRSATRSASQLVRRTHPCDSALDTFPGKGVPWMPYPSAERLIHTVPTGLFGPGLIVNGLREWTPLKW